MGKGKRLRRQRTTAGSATPTPVAAADYPFVVDTVTASTLGRDGLAVLAANLWPKDCQTCGWDLAGDKPTVTVSDMIVFCTASLHHARCRSPQWITDGLGFTKQELVSWTSQTLLLQGPPGTHSDRPVLLVNPWLEQIMIKRTSDGWCATTLETYCQSGLRSTPEGLLDLTPVADITAHLDADTITVRLDDTGQTWNGECSGSIRQTVTEMGGIILALTTAFNPAELRELRQVLDLVGTGQAALGWVALAGTQPAPLTEALPSLEALTTFILHFGNGHASVGELLATTDRALSLEAAQQWAQETIHTAMDIPPDQLIGWQQVSGDPQAVYTFDAISVNRFILRRHTDAWKLIKVAAEIGGRHGLDRDGIEGWATRAARTKAGTRIISWVPGPATDDGFTTLHSSGTPRWLAGDQPV